MTRRIWLRLPGLARRTARADRRSYRSESRPISISRLTGSLLPGLKRPIFIVGAPRSGTTFLGRCVGSLPGVSYHHEPVATKFAARLVYESSWSFAEARFFYRGVYRWLLRIHLDGDLRFSEKTPRNCFIIPFLDRCFPDASFIHIVRDGRDAALSYSKKPWLQSAASESGRREPGGHRIGPYARFYVERERIREFESTSDIHRCIWAWRRHVESAIEAAAELGAERLHEVRYERLVARPDAEADRLLRFLGVGDREAQDRFKAAVRAARSDSVGRWRQELDDRALSQIEEEAGSLLDALGYV